MTPPPDDVEALARELWDAPIATTPEERDALAAWILERYARRVWPKSEVDLLPPELERWRREARAGMALTSGDACKVFDYLHAREDVLQSLHAERNAVLEKRGARAPLVTCHHCRALLDPQHEKGCPHYGVELVEIGRAVNGIMRTDAEEDAADARLRDEPEATYQRRRVDAHQTTLRHFDRRILSLEHAVQGGLGDYGNQILALDNRLSRLVDRSELMEVQASLNRTLARVEKAEAQIAKRYALDSLRSHDGLKVLNEATRATFGEKFAELDRRLDRIDALLARHESAIAELVATVKS